MIHDGGRASYVHNEVSQRRCPNALNANIWIVERSSVPRLGYKPILDEIQPNSAIAATRTRDHSVQFEERRQCFLVDIRRLELNKRSSSFSGAAQKEMSVVAKTHADMPYE